MGVGAVVQSNLYGPLAENRVDKISEIFGFGLLHNVNYVVLFLFAKLCIALPIPGFQPAFCAYHCFPWCISL